MTLYIVLFIADIVTTLMNYRYLQYLEVNPIFKYVGIPGIIIANLLVIYFLHRWYTNESAGHVMRFYLITFMISICAIRLLALRNAISLINNPIPLEVAKAAGTETFKRAYAVGVVLVGWAIIALNFISFLLWNLDH